MAYSSHRIRMHIRATVSTCEEKYSGYREALEQAILKILDYEEDNQIQAFSIQQKVNEVFVKTAERLNKKDLEFDQEDQE